MTGLLQLERKPLRRQNEQDRRLVQCGGRGERQGGAKNEAQALGSATSVAGGANH